MSDPQHTYKAFSNKLLFKYKKSDSKKSNPFPYSKASASSMAGT